MSSSDESYQDARLIRSTSVPRKNKNVVRKTVRRTIRREESPNSKCLMCRLVMGCVASILILASVLPIRFWRLWYKGSI